MFSKAIILVAASFALLTAATPVPDNTGSCNTGDMHCCNSVHESDSFMGKTILSLLSLDVTGVTGTIGFTCSPLTVVGVAGGSSCSQQPVCCTDNNFNGLIAIGCSPVNLRK